VFAQSIASSLGVTHTVAREPLQRKAHPPIRVACVRIIRL
jgi:hypothetical protein